MIAKNSIFRKTVILSMAVLLLGLSLFNPFNRSAHAQVAYKLLADDVGTKVLAGIAEQAGIKYGGKTAREMAMKRWNMTLYNRIEEAKKLGDNQKAEDYIALADYIKQLNSTQIEPIPDRPGYGKILIDSSLYLSAAALGWEIGSYIRDYAANQEEAEFMEELSADLASGALLLSYGGITGWSEMRGEYPYLVLGNPLFPTDEWAYSTITMDLNQPHGTHIKSVTKTATAVSMQIAYFYHTWNGLSEGTSNHTYPISNLTEDFQSIGLVPDPSWVPDINLQPWVEAPPEITAMPEKMPVTIPIGEMPDVISDPWNEPVSDPVSVPETPPTDGGDGGGTTEPPTEETPSGNPFKDLVPVAFMLALLDLLRAILMYLARMFEFILTIPLVPIKEIDNQAFQWFKSAQIIGIHIYTVVSSLASIGLSFAVYKSVRRLLP